MKPLTRADLLSLEEYAEQRPVYRARVLAHKKNRQLALGDHARLYFEDRMSIQYQIQEMLRIEKIFEAQAIAEELDAYNPLIPDGNNWKATFMLEFEDPQVRAEALSRLVGIENKLWMQVQDCERVYPVANEDLERSSAEKTSAVHFLRFELSTPMQQAVHAGASITAGIDHPGYPVAAVAIPPAVCRALTADLAPTQLN